MSRSVALPALVLLLLAGCAADTTPDAAPNGAAPNGPEAAPTTPAAPLEPVGETPEQPPAEPLAEPPGCAAIFRHLEEHVRVGEQEELVLSCDASRVERLDAPVVLDVQGGNGHGGNLWFLRFDVGVETTVVERIEYRALANPPSGSVRRCTLPTASVRALLDAAGALPGIEVDRRRKPGAPHGASIRTSSNDSFVHVRVVDADGAERFSREFAGYAGSRSALRYQPIEAVVQVAESALPEAGWDDVPASDWRATRFPAAFRRNRELMVRKSHWWVMERSVEALGWFGDRTCLDTLAFLRDEYPDPQPRQAAKIRNVLEHPETYLEGPPREIPED